MHVMDDFRRNQGRWLSGGSWQNTYMTGTDAELNGRLAKYYIVTKVVYYASFYEIGNYLFSSQTSILDLSAHAVICL